MEPILSFEITYNNTRFQFTKIFSSWTQTRSERTRDFEKYWTRTLIFREILNANEHEHASPRNLSNTANMNEREQVGSFIPTFDFQAGMKEQA